MKSAMGKAITSVSEVLNTITANNYAHKRSAKKHYSSEQGKPLSRFGYRGVKRERQRRKLLFGMAKIRAEQYIALFSEKQFRLKRYLNWKTQPLIVKSYGGLLI